MPHSSFFARRCTRVVAVVFVAFFLLGCSGGDESEAPHSASHESKSVKSVKPRPAMSLFDGTTLNGWVIENGGQFSVRSGTIFVDRGTGWLRSTRIFSDFELVIEFRFLEPGANSGIFVRTGPTSHDDEKGYPDNGYQIQLMDTLGGDHPLGGMIPYGAPPFTYDYDAKAAKSAYKPTGEWQRYDITCRGQTLEVRLNGTLVTTAQSIQNTSGHIGIQAEGGLVQFRTVELRRLD